ncbi:MAG: sugar phosphate isomerase/epimerase [Chthoniobacter sp.]|uniref:sugar phosphate isomerase/epimerase family protein n=1 Tax=Chthoniobacter sp. TaxID=2510640 RepID=UPI0032A74A41
MKLPLRSLLLALAAITSSALAQSRDDSAAEKLGWHLATKAYTFRAITLYETIDITHALGLKYFELNPTQKLSPENPVNTNDTLPPELRAALKSKFAAAGIKVMNYGVVKLTKDEAADRKVFDFAKEMGIETIVSEPEDGSFDLLDKLTAEYGINVAIHNHPQPSHYFDPETVLAAIKGHSARIGACADTGHWTRSGLNAVDCLKKLEGHVITLHFKDVNDQKKDVVFGTGQTDIKGMLAELKRQNFHGVFSMEYESGAAGEQLVNELKECMAYFDREAASLSH